MTRSSIRRRWSSRRQRVYARRLLVPAIANTQPRLRHQVGFSNSNVSLAEPSEGGQSLGSCRWDGLEGHSGSRAKIDALGEETASLKRQIAATQRLISETVRPLSSEEAMSKVSEMHGLLKAADARQRRCLIHSLIEKVIVRDDAIEIYGAESTLVETASGIHIARAAARGSDRKWWAMTGSNRRHSRCKRDALPTELIARNRVRALSRLLRAPSIRDGVRRLTAPRAAQPRNIAACPPAPCPTAP